MLGPSELHQLDLLELVLADDSAHVAPIGPSLAAETRRVGAQRDGELIGVERLVAKQVRNGHLCRGREPKVVILDLEQIFFELGQLTGPEKAGGIDQERWQNLGIAVLTSVHVQHEADQSALQPRPDTPIDRESRAGDLGCTLQVENMKLG